jgi:hypothetical protein
MGELRNEINKTLDIFDSYQKLVHFFDSMDREAQRKEDQSQK